MTTALVTGAGGVLGRLLVRQLADEGVRTRAFVRSPASDANFPAGVETIVGDVRDASAVRRAAEGVDTIFHFAAVVHAAGADTRPLADYVQINVGGAVNVAAAAESANARVVFASTINVYGPGHAGMVDETTECRPEGAYAVTKRDAEIVLQRLGERATILRLAAVYGRNMKGNYQRLVRAIRRRRFVGIGRGTARKTVVYETDVVRAAIMAAFSPVEGGRIYNVTDGTTHTIEEIIAAIAAAAGVPRPRLRVPVELARIAARGADAAMRILGRPAGALSAVDKYLEDVIVSGENIQRQLGFRPAVDLRNGWRMALES